MSDEEDTKPPLKRRCVCLPDRLKWYGCLCGAEKQPGLNAAGESDPPTKDDA